MSNQSSPADHRNRILRNSSSVTTVMQFTNKIKRAALTACVVVSTLGQALVTEQASGASPASVAQGKQLFERKWPSGNPQMGGDGLGPLFNGQSCVACHHQGGVGGGGDSRFNAKTIGIESLRITGRVTNDVIANMVGTFHPGFVQSDGSVINTLTIPHHGGSPQFRKLNTEFLSNLPAEFGSEGGSISPTDVRQSYANPVTFHQKVGGNEIFLQARLFQRNTTSLFGAGLIDAVPLSEIKAVAIAQKKHPEISGRPATLRQGRVGKFGWRGNVATLVEFVDQACANEVGLETKRKPQGRDPLNPSYRNPAIDIQDEQVRAMRDFISALPAPVREIPESADERPIVSRGENVFATIGCAVCHVPNLGPAKGVYSDLLLHEMGPESIDLNHAEPYVVRRTPVRIVERTRVTTRENSGSMGAYYGATTTIESSSGGTRSFQDTMPPRTSDGGIFGQSPRRNLPRNLRRGNGPSSTGPAGYRFVAPHYPDRMMNIIDIRSQVISDTKDSTDENGLRAIETNSVSESTYLRIHYEPTRFNEEWRTPPLWGLRDSAPYLHDGRDQTVLEAIAMHDGESAGTRDRFLQLSLADRHAVLTFLNTLVAPPNVPSPNL